MTLKTPKWYFCMVQESIFNKTVAITGAGPAGCMCAKILLDNGIVSVIFEKGKPLATLIPTGGGRCNLAHAQFDFKELAKNYPRGEKFLYSVFSKFSTQDTLDFFSSIGVETYTQEDDRIFPVSNSSRDVRDKFLKALNGAKIIREKVNSIEKLDNCFKITTNKAEYAFDIVVCATGGHAGFDIAQNLGLKIITPVQALVGLKTEENFAALAGVVLQNVRFKDLTGNILFTHNGISGPLIYRISSIKARDEMPYKLNFALTPEFDIQQEFNNNPHKSVKNFLGLYVPKSFAQFLLGKLQIEPEFKCCKINANVRDKIYNALQNFELTIKAKVPDGEVVTAGGIDLNQINSKTMEVKNIRNLYFCGEVLDIDGFCGGFNLQNCWSTGAIAACAISSI